MTNDGSEIRDLGGGWQVEVFFINRGRGARFADLPPRAYRAEVTARGRIVQTFTFRARHGDSINMSSLERFEAALGAIREMIAQSDDPGDGI